MGRGGSGDRPVTTLCPGKPSVRLVASPHPVAFEVAVAGVLVFSKLETGIFPALEAVVEVVEAAARGEAVRKVEDTQAISCSWTR